MIINFIMINNFIIIIIVITIVYRKNPRWKDVNLHIHYKPSFDNKSVPTAVEV